MTRAIADGATTRNSTAWAGDIGDRHAHPPADHEHDRGATRDGAADGGDQRAAGDERPGEPAREPPLADEHRAQRDRQQRARAGRRHQDAEARLSEVQQLE
ncbi:MAG TPA: hypothetical protein VID68_08555 [Solirubrobacteraceae bacterium]